MCRDEVRDQILLFPRLFGIGIKQLFETVVAAHARLHHLRQWAFFRVLRGNLQITADVVGRQLFNVARIFHGDVVTHAGGDQDFLDTLQVTRATVKVDRRLVVGVHVLTDIRIDARQTTAGLLRTRGFAAQHIHVSRWATEIGDNAGKAWD
ncbi:hypothetical protein D3C71_1091680 [compost metagenome]